MTHSDVLTWVAEIFNVPADTLTPETLREEVPLWDSLGLLTLMAALDEKFGIMPSDEEMRAMQKVGDILDVLVKEGKLQDSSVK